jgi:hypothetical protein
MDDKANARVYKPAVERVIGQYGKNSVTAGLGVTDLGERGAQHTRLQYP